MLKVKCVRDKKRFFSVFVFCFLFLISLRNVSGFKSTQIAETGCGTVRKDRFHLTVCNGILGSDGSS